MELNESTRRPDGVSGNILSYIGYDNMDGYHIKDFIIMEWWCPKCGIYHHGLDCPEDDLTATPEVNIKVFIDNIRYEFCPYCGQLIEKEELS